MQRGKQRAVGNSKSQMFLVSSSTQGERKGCKVRGTERDVFQVYTLLLNSPGDLFIYGDPAPAANTGTTSAAQIQLSHDCQDSLNFRLALRKFCVSS